MTWLLFVVAVLWRIVFLTQAPTPIPGAEDNDFAPLIVVLIVALICLVLFGIGVALALVGVACAAVLVAMGIVTSSAVAAVLRRRVSAGVRAFHYQICAAVAVPAGVTILWAASGLFELQWRLQSILAGGVLAGIAAGLLLAGALDWTARLACRRFLPTNETCEPAAIAASSPR